MKTSDKWDFAPLIIVGAIAALFALSSAAGAIGFQLWSTFPR